MKSGKIVCFSQNEKIFILAKVSNKKYKIKSSGLDVVFLRFSWIKGSYVDSYPLSTMIYIGVYWNDGSILHSRY